MDHAIGQLSAEDYGKKAKETAKIMKWVDPSIKLVACGSSSAEMPTFPEWDRVVLEHLYEHVDYISCHRYYENLGDANDFLGSFADMDNFIKTIASYVQAKHRSKKKMYISFDEWNVWYQKKVELKDWEVAPPILEDNYSLLDALVFGGLMCTLLQHVDRVKMASLAQLVNVIAPIFTQKGGPAIKQAIFYPFYQVSNFGRGEVLNTLVDAPKLETNKHGSIPMVQSSTTYNANDNTLSIFALNCSEDEDLLLDARFRSFGSVQVIEHVVMDGPNLDAENSFENPENIKPRTIDRTTKISESLEITLPRMSWNMIRLQCEA